MPDVISQGSQVLLGLGLPGLIIIVMAIVIRQLDSRITKRDQKLEELQETRVTESRVTIQAMNAMVTAFDALEKSVDNMQRRQ